ncbi:hypothetical protein [Serratia plymuthica]|uniref:hypothetical protein n=1 Tax=Serratia plymuthica TaxID=82996 RepID=UPI003241D95F
MKRLKMTPALLTQDQIKALAKFAAKDGQPVYTIATGSIPEFEVDDGTQVQEPDCLL